jgi:hypothetical protein
MWVTGQPPAAGFRAFALCIRQPAIRQIMFSTGCLNAYLAATLDACRRK